MLYFCLMTGLRSKPFPGLLETIQFFSITGSNYEDHEDHICETLIIHVIRDKYCGVMKPLADMPSCLGGGGHRTNTSVEPTLPLVRPTRVDH